MRTDCTWLSLLLGVAVTHCRPSLSASDFKMKSACSAFKSEADAIKAAVKNYQEKQDQVAEKAELATVAG